MSAVELHAEQSGRPDGQTVLLLGSLGSTLAMWEPQLPALEPAFRVVRADLRGHGRSPVPPGPYSLDDLVDDVLALLDRRSITRAHVVGLSLGGMVAMRLAVREPARVDRLALLCTSAQLGPARGWADRAAAVRADGTGSVAAAVVARWLTTQKAAEDPDLVGRLQDMVASTPAEGYAGCCEALARMDQRGDLHRIRAATLAVAGAQDPATPPEHLEQVAAAVPGARLVVLPDAAHLASLEQATAVNAALLVHLGAGDTGREQGLARRRAVLGTDHVAAAAAATTPFTADFQDFITRAAWGSVWTRPGLDQQTRSLLTVALLTALGHEHELALHVRAALAGGVTPDQIAEVLLHTAVYAGVPAANRGFAVAGPLVAERFDVVASEADPAGPGRAG